jgi:hypothetical protein
MTSHIVPQKQENWLPPYREAQVFIDFLGNWIAEAQVRLIIRMRWKLIEELWCINDSWVATSVHLIKVMSHSRKENRIISHAFILSSLQHVSNDTPFDPTKSGTFKRVGWLPSADPVIPSQMSSFTKLPATACCSSSISAFTLRPAGGLLRKFILLPSWSPSQCSFGNSHHKSCNCLGSGPSTV